MNGPVPFQIKVPEVKLEQLHQQLLLTQFPTQVVTEDAWARGPPVEQIKRLVNYWRDGFDWRAQEVTLNELPQFTLDVEVEGFGAQNIHFIHKRCPNEGAIPLLFLHGWPGNFTEIKKMLPDLTKGDSNHPSFHVVAPSLINFEFSKGVLKVFR
jgi:hypothetical protein